MVIECFCVCCEKPVEAVDEYRRTALSAVREACRTAASDGIDPVIDDFLEPVTGVTLVTIAQRRSMGLSHGCDGVAASC
jgi:hypothetical protein